MAETSFSQGCWVLLLGDALSGTTYRSSCTCGRVYVVPESAVYRPLLRTWYTTIAENCQIISPFHQEAIMNFFYRSPISRYILQCCCGGILLVLLLNMLAMLTENRFEAIGVETTHSSTTYADYSDQNTPVAALRVVDQDNAPLVNASLRLLCYTDENATIPLTDRLYQTNATGHLIQPLPAKCPYAAVLQILHKQPAGKPGRTDAYWVYNTSWEPGTRQLHPTTDDIVVRDSWRLVLFDLHVDIEWTVPANDSYATELRAGFRLASSYLYDLTDGQMAFGPYSSTDGGNGWESADIRVRAANDYRPTAQVGGIVTAPISYITPAQQDPVFSPGEIWLSRYWDGFDGTDPIRGAWSTAAGYRTFVHEWMHYALFLYDEYQDADRDGRVESYCTCADLPAVSDAAVPGICEGVAPDLAASAMAYHYTATELWHQDLPVTCTSADQYFVHGEDDWATLTRWSAIQGLPTEWLRKPTELNAGPELGLAADLFNRRPTPAPSQFLLWLPLIQHETSTPQSTALQSHLSATTHPLSTTANFTGAYHIFGIASDDSVSPFLQSPSNGTHSNLTVTLQISPSLPALARADMHPQLYIQETLSETITGTVSQIRFVHQGTTVGDRSASGTIGEAPLLGVPAAGLLHASLDRYGPREAVRERYHTALTGVPTSESSATLMSDSWPTSIDIVPDMDGPLLTALSVTVGSRIPLTVTPVMRLCPPDYGCDLISPLAMQEIITNTWFASVTAPLNTELPHYAVLHVEAPGVGQVLRWVQMPGGVGPAHMDQHAPLRDGMLTVDATQQLTQTHSRVIVMPAADIDAVLAPLPPGLNGTLEQPLDVDIHLPGITTTLNVDRRLTVPMILTLFHGRAALNRLGINHQQLQLLHFQRSSGRWQLIPASGQSTSLNWLATTPVMEDGIYAVGWSNIPNLGRVPALLADTGPIPVAEPIRYQMLLPGNPELTTPSDAFMAVVLPPGLEFADYLHCPREECFYEPTQRVVQWQGAIGPDELVIVGFDLIVDVTPTTPCPPVVDLQAQFFDGVGAQFSQASTQIDCGVES